MDVIHKASYGDGMVVLSIKVGLEVLYVFKAHFPFVFGGGIANVNFFVRSPMSFAFFFPY